MPATIPAVATELPAHSASVTRRREGALPPAPQPRGALAVLSKTRARAAAAAVGPRIKQPPYVHAVAFIRQHGSATSEHLREHFGWTREVASSAMFDARFYGLIARNGVKLGRFFVYRPTVVPGWPT